MEGIFVNILSEREELLRLYIYYSSMLVIKVLLTSNLVSLNRILRKAVINPEDAHFLKVKPVIDEKIERIRRAHQNDIENIPVFFMAGFAYILTNPSLAMATFLFRTFVGARILHTVVYAIYVIPQPTRLFLYGVGYVTTLHMAVQSFVYFI